MEVSSKKCKIILYRLKGFLIFFPSDRTSLKIIIIFIIFFFIFLDQ